MSSMQVSMPQHTFDDIIDSMSVQTFSPDQIAIMIAGNEPTQVENRDVYAGAFKGVKVRVWKVAISHMVSYIELKRAYSKYCIAHPNISAVLGVCIQSGNSSDTTPTASARDDSDSELQSRQHTLWVVEESFGDESLHTRLERGLLSWQQVVKIATDICKALAFLQDLKRNTSAVDVETFSAYDMPGADDAMDMPGAPHVLSAYALRTIVTPSNVCIDSQSTKVSILC